MSNVRTTPAVSERLRGRMEQKIMENKNNPLFQYDRELLGQLKGVVRYLK